MHRPASEGIVVLARKRAQFIRSLAQKKFRDRHNCFLVEGVRLVREAVASDFEIVEAYYTEALLQQEGGAALVRGLERKTRCVENLNPRQLQSISNTVSAQGVLAVLNKRDVPAGSILIEDDRPHVVVACDAISDPGNLGSIVRTCDWFAVDGMLISDSSVEFTSPKVVRGTMGGIFHVPIAAEVDLRTVLQEANRLQYTVYVSDLWGDVDADAVHYAKKALVVLGNEARGVSDAVRSQAALRICLPRYGMAESLNVGVACGIFLSTLRRS